MKIKIKLTGVDELKSKFKMLRSGVDSRALEAWTNAIQETAKEICNDVNGSRIKLKATNYENLHAEFADKISLDCIIKAIESYLNSMPSPTKEIYKKLILDLKKKKRIFKTDASI